MRVYIYMYTYPNLAKGTRFATGKKKQTDLSFPDLFRLQKARCLPGPPHAAHLHAHVLVFALNVPERLRPAALASKGGHVTVVS